MCKRIVGLDPIVFKDSRQKETVDKHGFIIRKSKKSYSLYIIVNNKKIRISEHTNNYPTNDLFINFIYSLDDSIYNILKEVEKNISKMLLTK